MKHKEVLERLKLLEEAKEKIEELLQEELNMQVSLGRLRGKRYNKATDNFFLISKERRLKDREFFLELEFDIFNRTCSILSINLPEESRYKGLGTRIIQLVENLARELFVDTLLVDAEHRSVEFWLKRGFHFNFKREESFYKNNSDRQNIYTAYDLRKSIS